MQILSDILCHKVPCGSGADTSLVYFFSYSKRNYFLRVKKSKRGLYVWQIIFPATFFDSSFEPYPESLEMSVKQAKSNCSLSSLFLKIFYANHDSETVVYNVLAPPITARLIRILPVEWHNQISMRLEIYGCPGIKKEISMQNIFGSCLQSILLPSCVKRRRETLSESRQNVEVTAA